jgi:hypothetical protein
MLDQFSFHFIIVACTFGREKGLSTGGGWTGTYTGVQKWHPLLRAPHICMMYAGYMTHIVRVTFAPDSRRMRADANVARTCTLDSPSRHHARDVGNLPTSFRVAPSAWLHFAWLFWHKTDNCKNGPMNTNDMGRLPTSLAWSHTDDLRIFAFRPENWKTSEESMCRCSRRSSPPESKSACYY